jgi:hypothetical protein
MKTTIDLADDLAASLKKRTAREGISMRAAVHQALRLWLKSRPEPAASQGIPRDVGLMSGQGLSPNAAALSWDDLRALSYDQRS